MTKGYIPPLLLLRDLFSGGLLCHSFDMTGVDQEVFVDSGDFDWAQ